MLGDNQALISAYIRKLLSLNQSLNILNVNALRTLYNTIKTYVCLLYSLGQDCANVYSSLVGKTTKWIEIANKLKRL